MTNKFMRKREKIRAQMKSRWYYSFWGAAPIAVVAGQVYVGSGYRAMARSLDRWLDTAIEALIPDRPKPRTGTPVIPDRGGYYMPVPTPDDYGMTIVK